jgi:hypothetical protein
MRFLELDTNGEFSLTRYLIDKIPPYAILSHTWGDDNEEITFGDIEKDSGKTKIGTTGYGKIQFCAEQASHDKLQYFWVDTCCIDKSNSSELSEAINSMFHWYRNAYICYVYLSDFAVPSANTDDESRPPPWESDFLKSRWFTRSWTLQELISPREVVFFDRNWHKIGTRSTLGRQLVLATGIPERAYISLESFSVAQKMSWASKRMATRVEDIAYSILGIFGVNMPMLYGEGPRAFVRLQEEIIKKSDDESIFAWSVDDKEEEQLLVKKLQDQLNRDLDERYYYAYPTNATTAGRLFAPRPSCFAHCASVRRDAFFWRGPYTLTNKGLEILTMVFQDPEESRFEKYMVPLNCSRDAEVPLAMTMTKCLGYWMRCGIDVMPGEAAAVFKAMEDRGGVKQIYISAQWPRHGIQNKGTLNAELLTDEEGYAIVRFGQQIRIERRYV